MYVARVSEERAPFRDMDSFIAVSVDLIESYIMNVINILLVQYLMFF